MMKKWLNTLVLVLVLSLAASAQSIPKWKLADLKSAIADAKEPTVFNFWATWCKPCVEEIPYFQSMVAKYKAEGVKLVLVSLDMTEAYPKKITEFAAKRKFTAPIVFLDETNADLFCPVVDSSWSGAIPASLFINPKTGYRSFAEEQLKPEQLEARILAMLGRKEP
jgi:thiol-disulfide isomerase/thioredoxin